MLNKPINLRELTHSPRYIGLRVGLLGISIGFVGGVVAFSGWLTTGVCIGLGGGIIAIAGLILNTMQVIKDFRSNKD